MRVPKIKNGNSEVVKEQTIDLGKVNKVSMHDNAWQEDEKSLDKTIKAIERIVRGSFEYKEYVKFLKEEMDMNECSFIPGVDRRGETGISIELHHSPMTLYDITSVIFNYKQIHSLDPSHFDIADEVMKAHFEGLVGLVPLSITVHELFHNGEIFIPVDKVHGSVKGFYNRYRDGFTEDHKNALRENVKLTKQLNKETEDYSPAVLQRKFTYVKIEGVEFPSKIKTDEAVTA